MAGNVPLHAADIIGCCASYHKPLAVLVDSACCICDCRGSVAGSTQCRLMSDWPQHSLESFNNAITSITRLALLPHASACINMTMHQQQHTTCRWRCTSKLVLVYTGVHEHMPAPQCLLQAYAAAALPGICSIQQKTNAAAIHDINAVSQNVDKLLSRHLNLPGRTVTHACISLHLNHNHITSRYIMPHHAACSFAGRPSPCWYAHATARLDVSVLCMLHAAGLSSCAEQHPIASKQPLAMTCLC